MNSEQNATILYIEPKRVADFDIEMLKSPQLFTSKFYAIRLLYSIFQDSTLQATSINIVKKFIKEYPDLTDEIKQRFPEISD